MIPAGNSISPTINRMTKGPVEALSEIHGHLRVEMYRAQLRHQESADEHRLPAPDYRVGGFVWLDARNWKTRRPSAKLDSTPSTLKLVAKKRQDFQPHTKT